MFEWTFDSTPPTMGIAAGQFSSNNDYSNADMVTLTFTSSENTNDFDASDVICEGGVLNDFLGSGTTYTATFTPTGGDGEKSVRVRSGSFHDHAGNGNMNASSSGSLLTWNYDSISPTVAITTKNGHSGAYLNSPSLEFHLSFSENAIRFEESYVIAYGGDVSDFSHVGNMMYSTTFTSDGSDGQKSLSVLPGAVSDAAENTNNSSETFEWTLDTTSPTVTISTSEGNSGFHSSALSLEFSLSFSENVVIASPPDIQAIGGEIGDVTRSGAMYKLNFTCSGGSNGVKSIRVNSNSFFDMASNGNNASETFEWVHDTVAPTIEITSSMGTTGFTSNDGAIELKFNLSEGVSNFAANNIVAEGAYITNFIQTDTLGANYDALLVSNSDEGLKTVHVGPNAFQDSAKTFNEASNTFEWTYDISRPTVVITSSEGISGFNSNQDLMAVTYKFSESVVGFEADDVLLSGLETVSFSKLNKTAFTASYQSNEEEGLKSITVLGAVCTDLAGNDNDNSESFEWIYDTTSPTVVVSSSQDKESGFASSDTQLSLVFTTSEISNDFVLDGLMNVLTVQGLVLVDHSYSTSGLTYTATFEPIGDGLKTVYVHADAFSDLAGNTNLEVSNTFEWNCDTSAPSVQILSGRNSSGFYSNEDHLDFVVTLSERCDDFSNDTLVVNGGYVSHFVKESENKYVGTFMSSETQGLKSIYVAANTITDIASNFNADPATLWWNHDTVSPTMSILSEIGASGFSTNQSSLTFTFQANEALPDVSIQDNIVVNGGVLSSMTAVEAGMDDHLYTAVFTHTIENGLKSIHVPIGSIQDLAMNSNVDASNTFEWTYDTAPPTLAIDSINGYSGFKSDEAWIAVVFTLSEACSDFDETDLIITGNAALSNFTGDQLMFDAVLYFTGEEEGSEILTVQVASSSFTDKAGNKNNISTFFKWQHGTEKSSGESFMKSPEFYSVVGVTVGITVAGLIAYILFHSARSVSKVENPVQGLQGTTTMSSEGNRTKRPSHSLDMQFDEEKAISIESSGATSDEMHGL
jgi:large repetitive protein